MANKAVFNIRHVKQLPAVITPLGLRVGLDIARSLGAQGVPVYGIDTSERSIGHLSKYCQVVVGPDPQHEPDAYVRFLVDWGQKLDGKAVLYPIKDYTVLLCSEAREQLYPYYEFVMPEHETIVKLLTKQGLAEISKTHAIPAPQTLIPKGMSHVKSVVDTLTYPVILKPVHSPSWHIPEIVSLLREGTLSGRAKVKVCEDAEELLHFYAAIAAYDKDMIIQEVIPGPDENLVYISFYLNRKSEVMALFAGRKLRVLPVGFGSASYARSFHDPALEEVALRLLKGVSYQGLGGLEFKKDSRDGVYKLIECNTRFGLWDGLGRLCGVDTAYIAYLDALNLSPEAQLTYQDDYIWVDIDRDIRAFLMYRRQGRLTLGAWLRSLVGKGMWSIYDWQDWRPGVAFSGEMLRAFWNRIFAKKATEDMEH